MDTSKNFIGRLWRPAAVLLGLGLLGYYLFFNRLGNLVAGYSSQETATVAASSNWHAIVQNPVNAPYKGLVWLLHAVLQHGFISTRIVSASFGLAAVLVYFIIVRKLFSFRIACLGTLLFATSSGLLHSARLGTPQILEMGVLAFIGSILWYRASERKPIVGYVMVFLCAILCYVPGLIWYELLGFILLRNNVRRRVRATSALHVVGYSVLFLATLVPLLRVGAHHSTILLNAAGLPADIHQFGHFVTNFWHGLLAIGIRSDGNPLLWVGHAPLLNSIELVLAAMGVYYYVFRERSIRTIFMLGGIIISLVLIGFGTLAGYAALVPLLYIFIVSGLHQLLEQWLTVFPRNPYAKFIGIGLVCIMLFFSVLYQVRSYFVAWPHTAATQRTFDIHQSR